MRHTFSAAIRLTSAAGMATLSLGPLDAANIRPRVYVLCTVREVVNAPGQAARGKVYRSAVFSAPGDYDGDGSNSPPPSGSAHRQFEMYLSRTYGLHPDRSRMGGTANYSCIEAPDTAQGRSHLETVREVRSDESPSVEVVLTNFIPPQYKPTAGELQFEGQQEEYELRRKQYESDLAAHRAAQQKVLQQAKAAGASARAATKAQADFAAQMKKFKAAQDEYERQRAQYEREYERATGSKPPR